MFDIISKALLCFTSLLGVAFVVLAVSAISEDDKPVHFAELYADETGCTFIGRTSNPNSIGFFQCSDNINLKRLK